MEIRPDQRGFEVLPAPVAVAHAGRLLYVNPALAAVLGTDRDQLIGMSVPELMDKFLGSRDASWIDALREGPPPASAEGAPAWVALRTPSGERAFRVEVAGGPREGERVYLLIDAEGDAAARRLTEALAASTGALFACRKEWDVLDAAVEAIAQQGFATAVLLVQGEELVHGPMRQDPEQLAAASRLYGKPITEVRFKLSGLPHLQRCIASRRGAFYHDIIQAFAGFHSPEVLAIIGKQYPNFRGVDAPIFLDDKPYAVIGVQGPSLTPASAATIALFARQVGAALENVRHHRSAAEQVERLARLQADLVTSERLAAVGEAAAVVAHEIRNPVGAILNAVAILRRDPPTASVPTVVGMLEEEGHRLEHLVRALLDYTGRLEPHLGPVSLGEIVQRTAALLKSRNVLGAVKLEALEPTGGGTVNADADLLELALVNLTMNAIQASPPGATVTLRAQTDGRGGSLIVEDQGPGIGPEDAARILDPFFTTRARGSGLGLAVVNRVAGAHGGKLIVGASPSGGARFELRLP